MRANLPNVRERVYFAKMTKIIHENSETFVSQWMAMRLFTFVFYGSFGKCMDMSTNNLRNVRMSVYPSSHFIYPFKSVKNQHNNNNNNTEQLIANIQKEIKENQMMEEKV